MLFLKQKKDITDGKGARRFMSGVLLLSLSTVIVKVIGLAFKIPMLSVLGTDGMGYFNSAYEIYALLCVISTAGLPVALSMLVSASRAEGDTERVKKVYRAAKMLFAFLGISGAAFMTVFAKNISEGIGNEDAYYCILAIAPALFFVCMSSAVRGYCQGFEYMLPTAVSQLTEALGKLIFGVAFAVIAVKKGYSLPIVSAFAVLGITVGCAVSLLYLLVFGRPERLKETDCGVETEKRKNKTERRAAKTGKPLSELVSIALPITLGSAVLSLTRLIDMALIMRRLQESGMSAAYSNRIYGAYTTLALPVFSLIPSLITPISMALVPQMSAFVQKKDKEGQRIVLENSLRLTSLLSLPASFGLTLFARPILEILFSGQNEAINMSAPLLSILGGSVVFSCLITTTNAILQSYRRAGLPIISMSVGVIVKFIATYVLTGIKSVGVMGAPIGSLCCNITVTVINVCFLGVCSKSKLRASAVLFKPLLASLTAVSAAYALYLWVERVTDSLRFAFGVALLLAVALYAAVSFFIGSISAEDIALLPMGDKLLKKLKTEKNKD